MRSWQSIQHHAAPILLLAITLSGGFLRFYQLGDKGLWLDEAFSVWMGWRPLGEMLAWLVKIDQHPPLYYTLLHFWMALGDDAATVRALSALLGALTIPVIFLLGRRLADDKVGLLAALILAVAPFHVRFAQEARMYTLLTLNVTLALYALARLLTDPRAGQTPFGQQFVNAWRNRRAIHHPSLREIETDLTWTGYILFTTAAMLSHNTAVLFPLAANLLILSYFLLPTPYSLLPNPQSPIPGHQFPRNWLLAQLGVFLLWSPWLPAFVAQSARVYEEFWLPRPTWETVAAAVGAFLSDFPPHQPDCAGLAWGVSAVLIILGIIHFRRKPARLTFLLIIFATPLLGEWLVSLRRPIFYDRTLIWASIPLYLLLAAGMRQLRFRPCIIAVAALMVTTNTLSVREYYTQFKKEEWDKAAAFVAARVEPGDLILFNATWVQIPFDFYYRAYNRPTAEHGAPVDLFERGILEPKMSESDLPRLRELIRGYDRVWLVYSHDWYTDPERLIPRTMEEGMRPLGQWEFYGLQVRLYGM